MLDEQVAREFAERYLEAWNSHDAERIEPLVTGDVVWLDPALPEPARGVGEVKGLHACRLASPPKTIRSTPSRSTSASTASSAGTLACTS